jgi:predicted metal-binding membrane protein
MVAAMMLPASAPMIAELGASRLARARPLLTLGQFLLPYLVVWGAFGLAAFAGDVAIHAFVDATSWLAAHPSVIPAVTLAAAGVFELTPLKAYALGYCREPSRHIGPGESPMRIGLEHALACLGSSWALMLVMFGAGLANLAWMAGLTVVMAYQALGRHGLQTVPLVAAALLGLAFLAIAAPAGVLEVLVLGAE